MKKEFVLKKNLIKIISISLATLLVVMGVLLFVLKNNHQNDGDQDGEQTDEVMLTYFDATLSSGSLEFTHSILNMEDFDRIIPLGQINPPGHTFPTDHIYFVTNGLDKPVYAPTSGKVLFIEEAGMYGDGAIRISVSNTMTYYLGHVFASANLKVGDMVSMGQQIGLSGITSYVDFGLLYKEINNGFLSDKMPLTTKYGDKPLSYYTEPLRSQLYEKVMPPNPNPAEYPDFVYSEEVTDGEFAIDQLGTLRGNWIEQGKIESGWYEWDATLSFGYDVYYKDQIRIGSGKHNYVFAIHNDDNPTKPENVTTSSGAVAYYLYNGSNTLFGEPSASREGLLMVQLLTDTTLKLEIFNDITSESRAFTSNALFYSR